MGGLCPALDMRMTQSIDMDDQSSRTSIEVRSPAWMERHQTNAVRLIHGSADGFSRVLSGSPWGLPAGDI